MRLYTFVEELDDKFEYLEGGIEFLDSAYLKYADEEFASFQEAYDFFYRKYREQEDSQS